jgi:hypothetical protein
MSYNPNKLLTLTAEYAEFAESSLTKLAKEVLDPKAKVRNRGTVCIPAESAKDKKDHFPINDEAQARNALAQVGKYTAVPAWYSGSLEGLKKTIRSKVHAKYPSIKEAPVKKKSFLMHDFLISKYGQEISNDQRSQLDKSTTGEYLGADKLSGDIKSSLTEIAQKLQSDPIGRNYATNINMALNSTTFNLDYLAKSVQNTRNIFLSNNQPDMAEKALKTYQALTLLNQRGDIRPTDGGPSVPGRGGTGNGTGGNRPEGPNASKTPNAPAAGHEGKKTTAPVARTIKPIDYRKDPELLAGVHAATDWMGQNPGLTSYVDLFNKIKTNLDGNQSADVLYKYLQRASTMTRDPATEDKIKASMKYMMDRYGPNSKNWNPATQYSAPSTVGAPGEATSVAPDTYQSTGNPINPGIDRNNPY